MPKIHKLHLELDNGLVVDFPDIVQSKYIVLNCINWNNSALQNLPLQDASEFSYFVLPVTANGLLQGINPPQENAFVAAVHKAGKKATFSIAGGTQDVAAITQAVTQKTTLISSIATHLQTFNYDGVKIDVEGTNIDPQVMADFITSLRAKFEAIRPGLIIGVDVQGYQVNTVWSKIDTYVSALNYVIPLLYDSGYYNQQQMITWMNQWTKVPKEKLMLGVAVNYPDYNTGLNTTQFSEMCDAVNTNGWCGMGIWQNVSYTQPWTQVRRTKLPNIA